MFSSRNQYALRHIRSELHSQHVSILLCGVRGALDALRITVRLLSFIRLLTLASHSSTCHRCLSPFSYCKSNISETHCVSHHLLMYLVHLCVVEVAIDSASRTDYTIPCCHPIDAILHPPPLTISRLIFSASLCVVSAE